MRTAATLAAVAAAAPPPHGVPLRNAAAPGMVYPAIGLGTGGYGYRDSRRYPECWLATAEHDCRARVVGAVSSWLRMGGRRLDTANSYYNLDAVGEGIRDSGVPREAIFITTKVGPGYPLGYTDTKQQLDSIRSQLSVESVDLTLVHWPDQKEARHHSQDRECDTDRSDYNATACRLSTWRALVDEWKAGRTRAIGVANFDADMIGELEVSGLPMPAIDQCPFNPYRGLATYTKLAPALASRGIALAGYSPLGVPDLAVSTCPQNESMVLHGFPKPMSPTLLADPAVTAVASKHGLTPAQVLISWQWRRHRVPLNPRTANQSHMAENLAAVGFELPLADAAVLDSLPQNWCSTDPKWYECAPDATPAPLIGCGV
eukprot:TRINITY_DN5496_c0_g1_i1.p1 TRINITY_DN5496_c0_g1~~TRINITY_DN5496_c0_g1_i1.p1  ORF type:complete len:391 (+),score=102.95 TRINITY_DN5496_c0_g1_i1:53-1174(+)